VDAARAELQRIRIQQANARRQAERARNLLQLGAVPAKEYEAANAGVKVVTNLYDGSLSSGTPADTYINMMRHNVTQMVNALR